MQLKNKNVIITGASSGIGYDLMVLLLERGATVIASSRKISLSDIEHPNLYKYDCDMSCKEGIDKLLSFALKKFEHIDAFIANAGFAYYGKTGSAWEDMQKIYCTNVLSSIYAATKLKEISGKKPYNFMITASAMAFVSLPGYALYSSTKSALRGFADAYRYELEKGQHLQMVYPIATITKFFDNAGGIPMAWPRQSSKKVAKTMLKSLEKNKANTYPSKIFVLFKCLSGICPLFTRIYMNTYNKVLYKWLKNKDNDKKEE